MKQSGLHIRICDTSQTPYILSKDIVINDFPKDYANSSENNRFRIILLDNNQKILYEVQDNKTSKLYIQIGTINYENGTVNNTKYLNNDITDPILKIYEFKENDDLSLYLETEKTVKKFIDINSIPKKTFELRVKNQSRTSLFFKQDDGNIWYAFVIKDIINFYCLDELLIAYSNKSEKIEFFGSKPTFTVQLPTQEYILNFFFNKNKQMLFIHTSNSLYHYDFQNKTFLNDLKLNTQLTKEISFMKKLNKLVLHNKGFQTEMHTLNFKYSKRSYIQKESIDNLRCLDIDIDKAVQNITYIQNQHNSTAFIVENFFKSDEKIYKHNSAFSVKSMVGTKSNKSPQKFDFFHFQNLGRQPISWQTLEISQINQKYTLYDDIENQNIGFVRQSNDTQDILNSIINQIYYQL